MVLNIWQEIKKGIHLTCATDLEAAAFPWNQEFTHVLILWDDHFISTVAAMKPTWNIYPVWKIQVFILTLSGSDRKVEVVCSRARMHLIEIFPNIFKKRFPMGHFQILVSMSMTPGLCKSAVDKYYGQFSITRGYQVPMSCHHWFHLLNLSECNQGILFILAKVTFLLQFLFLPVYLGYQNITMLKFQAVFSIHSVRLL